MSAVGPRGIGARASGCNATPPPGPARRPRVRTALLLVATLAACTQPPPPVRPPDSVAPTLQALRVGDTTLTLALHAGPPPGPTLVALHDDEDTAVEVARAFVAARGGLLVEVRAQGTRLVAFELGGARLRFDPNRVFTPAGRAATLALHNTHVPSGAARELQRFADAVLAPHAAAQVLVAVHNNTDGGWSAASYQAGGDHAADAAALHLPRGADPDHFVLATTRAPFDALVRANVPTVLQHPGARDDGSLSVHAMRNGITYLNVEAEHGHADAQRALLEAMHAAGASRPQAGRGATEQ